MLSYLWLKFPCPFDTLPGPTEVDDEELVLFCVFCCWDRSGVSISFNALLFHAHIFGVLNTTYQPNLFISPPNI